MGYRRIQGLEWVTRSYKGLQGEWITGGFKGLQWVTRVRMGCKELQVVTWGYKVLQGVTEG